MPQRYRDFVARGRRGREDARARPCAGLPRRSRAPLQADGLQGRVRGRAALHRRRVPRRSSSAQFEGDYKLEFHLAPPLLAAARSRRPASCRSAPTAPWMLQAFRLLARFKRLRGTALRSLRPHRRARAWSGGSSASTRRTVRRARWPASTPDNHALAVEIATPARAHPRLRPYQGAQRRRGQGARGGPARRLPHPPAGSHRRRVTQEPAAKRAC